ncbi:C-type lectin domain-containing protein [Meloidogyne graminicola]|uniref:C-type lectin domain-containing protein n=1 Tax=Meloidogyne graminicola TaxID=189291 RepID=A0A8S9ZFF9_9BILA|nr:C-type lectin domain-containing protein [Meloidogyne graminicola]
MNFLANLILLTLLSSLNISFICGDCSDDWSLFSDENGNNFGYQVVKRDYLINFYTPEVICKEIGGNVVSIHSQDENDFVAQLPGTASSALWIGYHVLQNNDSSLTCLWTDKSNSAYGNYTSVDDPNRQNNPWLALDPVLTDPYGDPNQCVEIVDTSFDTFDSANVLWLETPCYSRINGVVCKMDCSA